MHLGIYCNYAVEWTPVVPMSLCFVTSFSSCCEKKLGGGRQPTLKMSVRGVTCPGHPFPLFVVAPLEVRTVCDWMTTCQWKTWICRQFDSHLGKTSELTKRCWKILCQGKLFHVNFVFGRGEGVGDTGFSNRVVA